MRCFLARGGIAATAKSDSRLEHKNSLVHSLPGARGVDRDAPMRRRDAAKSSSLLPLSQSVDLPMVCGPNEPADRSYCACFDWMSDQAMKFRVSLRFLATTVTAGAWLLTASAFAQETATEPPWLSIEPSSIGRPFLDSSPRPLSVIRPLVPSVELDDPSQRLALDFHMLGNAIRPDPAVARGAYVLDDGKPQSGAAGTAPETIRDVDDGQPLQLTSPAPKIIQSLADNVTQVEQRLGQNGQTIDPELASKMAAIREKLGLCQKNWDAANSLDAEIKTAPAQAQTLKQTLSTAPAEDPEDEKCFATVAEAQSALDAAKQLLDKRQQEFDQKQNSLKQRPAKKTDTDAEIGRLRQKVSEKPPTVINPDASDADLLAQLADRAEHLRNRTLLLRDEVSQLNNDATLEVATLERDLLQRQLNEQQKRVEILNVQVTNLRHDQAQQQAEKAQRDIQQAPAAIRSLAEKNARLAQQREDLLQKIEIADGDLKELEQQRQVVEKNHKNLVEKVKVAGMNRTVGILMRKQVQELPDVWSVRGKIKQNEREIPTRQLEQMDFDDLRDKFSDVHGIVQEKLNQITAEQGVAITPSLEAKVKELVTMSYDLTGDLAKDFGRYVELLSDINVKSQSLIESTNAFRYFVDKNILWIRSTDPLNGQDVRNTLAAFAAVGNQLEPLVGAFDVGKSLASLPTYLTVAAILLVIGWLAHRWLRRSLLSTAESAARSSSRRLAVVVKLSALTLVLACFWPATLWTIGQYLNNITDSGLIAAPMAAALLAIVPFVSAACVVRQLTLRNGFADVYFAWPKSAIAALNRAVKWYMWTVLPLRCTGVFFDQFHDGAWAASAGRSMFIVSQIMLFVCLSFGIRQVSKAVLGGATSSNASIWKRTRRVWTTVLVIFPIGLAGMSLVGYHYSANVLSYRFGWTMWIILAAVSFVSLSQQIILIVLHKISLRRFWLSHSVDDEQAEGEPDEFDPDKVNYQIGRLLRGFTLAGVAVATFFLWAQVLPAIQILDRVELWTHSVEVAETQTLSDGTQKTQMDTQVDTITLADLAWCSVLLVLTALLSRNLPGLLEVTLLDRLPLDRGGKYAISVVCRYLVAIVGIIFACRTLGFAWSSVQWLVAAMSVGLGFGLQEIFGNFVSGIIILLERPIRIGDLVTVNGTTGCVTRIQLRATTILDFDRREMIVPNKRFITDDVVNWTLTDPIMRMVVPVGIAYGSDTELACHTLMEVARRHRNILEDPEPAVVFKGFGASSLDLELRVFIAERERFADVQHGLHMDIDRAFRDNNIEIAFPQQDLHVRSIAPLATAIVSARDELKRQRKSNAA